MTREQYVKDLYAQEDDVLLAVRQSIVEQGMPAISVSPSVGKLLTMLVKMTGAKQVLEVGALGGYSGICLTRGVGAEGKLTSLELKQEFADLAQANMERAGFGGQAEYRIGYANDSLEQLAKEGRTFDFFFIDADKDNYWNYVEWAIRLANPGAVIAADNVLWSDRVLDPENEEPNTLALKEFNKKVAADDRLEAMLLPLSDGLTLARIK